MTLLGRPGGPAPSVDLARELLRRAERTRDPRRAEELAQAARRALPRVAPRDLVAGIDQILGAADDKRAVLPKLLQQTWLTGRNGRGPSRVDPTSTALAWWACPLDLHEPWRAPIAAVVSRTARCPGCPKPAAARQRQKKPNLSTVQASGTSVRTVSGGLPTLGRRR